MRASFKRKVKSKYGCCYSNVKFKGRAGTVIGNSIGKIITAIVKRVYYKEIRACIEVEALLFGIQFAQQAKCVPMIIKSNN